MRQPTRFLNMHRIMQYWHDLGGVQKSATQVHILQAFIAISVAVFFSFANDDLGKEAFYFFGLGLVHFVAIILVLSSFPIVLSYLLTAGVGGSLMIGLFCESEHFSNLGLFILFMHLFWGTLATRKSDYDILFLVICLFQIGAIFLVKEWISIPEVGEYNSNYLELVIYSIVAIISFVFIREFAIRIFQYENSKSTNLYAPSDFVQLLCMTLCGSVGMVEKSIEEMDKSHYLENEVMQKMKIELHELRRAKDDLIGLNDHDNSTLTFYQAPFLLSDLIDEVVEHSKPIFLPSKIQLHYDSHLNADLVVSDAYRIKQLIRTLLLNSIDNAAYGDIYLSCFSDTIDEQVEIYFHIQNATALVPSNLDLLFTEGADQLHLDVNRFSKRLLKNILNELGAECSQLNNSTIGDSIEIRFQLPLYQSSDFNDLSIQQRVGIEPKKIIYADDDPVMLLLMEKLFSSRDESLSTFSNGQKCLENFIEYDGQIDLIFMDCNMDIMDGFEATKAIRKYEILHHLKLTPIIALTASTESENKQKCYDCGMNFVMEKPVTKKEVFEIVDQILKTPCYIS